ncbi:PmoA family protein [Mucilaginibacter daejeonensis]|uniref:DUF6807 domain-containing protein n=1 Tax=Mucilaginibacter daejeonensis TaxID=398049 RepID=UPI001D17474A|nr:PmoA family protein [Mucilaginibacter daejeonensis]UEG52468.1 PmoA family protein [Mucilaginibacter daejeonensis]
MAKSWILTCCLLAAAATTASAQDAEVTIKRNDQQKKVDVMIGGEPFTTFMYPDTLEKPTLYPIATANGTTITRGFPLNPKPGDPTDHPHHIGLWFNFENLNGLDFWNNSYAIPPAKKDQYGWIRTQKITEAKSGRKGILAYMANWTDKAGDVILTENTRYEFSGINGQRIIDRVTTLKAVKKAVFNDAKDGMLGLRLAHELQMPTTKDEKFADSKGIVTVVKGGTDKVPTGMYRTSEGKMGDAAWSTRGVWCEVYGKMGNDSVTVAMIDHPGNPNYPTFWHARGYGLFAANPLGEKIFTNGASAKNLTLEPGQSVTFKYRVIVSNGNRALTPTQLNAEAKSFAKK